MHLVEPLVIGIRGAESGTVYFYRRGTSTFITYYTSYEGDGATTPSGGVALDTNGGGVFYVNETCNVVVRDSGGTTLRTFVAGPNASAIEAISQSFTGTDYASAQTGASKPLALKTLLDLWYTNAGAIDWKVSVGGVATTLRNAFATVGAAFINVKATLYGAVGDGVANDTSAVQAALDAAQTAGGGTVFFPAGTYKITSALTVAAKVSLAGAGAAASRIQAASGSIKTLTLAADLSAFTSISGLRIGPSQANSNNVIDCTAGRLLRVEYCEIDADRGGPGIAYDVAGTIIIANANTFVVAGGQAMYDVGSSTAVCHVFGCLATVSGAYSSGVFQNVKGSIIATTADMVGMSSGSANFLFPVTGIGGSLPGLLVAGCRITNPTGGTVGAWSTAASSNAFDGFTEFGNSLASAIVPGEPGGDAAKSTYKGQHHGYRERARSYTLDNTAAVTVTPSKYALAEVERTTTGAQTCTLSTVVPPEYGPVNQDFTLIYNNLAQASPTGLITVSGASGLTSFTVNANCCSAYFFKLTHVGTSSRWSLTGSAVNLT